MFKLFSTKPKQPTETTLDEIEELMHKASADADKLREYRVSLSRIRADLINKKASN